VRKNESAHQKRGDPLSRKLGECRVNFSLSAGIQDNEFHAKSPRGLLRIFHLGLETRAARKPTDVAAGTNSRSNSNRFALSSLSKKLTPVTFPPGWLRLDTKPSSIGLPPLVNTIGIVVVAALAATTAGGPPARIALTRRLTKSAASLGSFL